MLFLIPLITVCFDFNVKQNVLEVNCLNTIHVKQFKLMKYIKINQARSNDFHIGGQNPAPGSKIDLFASNVV